MAQEIGRRNKTQRTFAISWQSKETTGQTGRVSAKAIRFRVKSNVCSYLEVPDGHVNGIYVAKDALSDGSKHESSIAGGYKCYAPLRSRAVGIESTGGQNETDSAAVMKMARRTSRGQRGEKWEERRGEQAAQKAEENPWNLPPIYAEICGPCAEALKVQSLPKRARSRWKRR
ncbi:hypothetical protein SCHPADRAFT_744145 [Schizopora paradoxa]|uniref:Uncharacterized protein n=1 Tax=Schizopora paradoxa TaxID=27342 RepID=A0A0H2R5T8_9AGAM|nr:hypothetical protein SCHPADRAFT_744145 [Schizopora paradoxa]